MTITMAKYTIEFDAKAEKLLDDLTKMEGVSTRTEVFQLALSLLITCREEKKKGNKILVTDLNGTNKELIIGGF